MSDEQFTEECFHFGREGEQAYVAYSLRNNRILIEVGALREKLGSGAPMIYLPEAYLGKDKLISPDFLTVNAQAMLKGNFYPWADKSFVWTAQNMWSYPFLWNEVKSKNGCTWSLKLKCWQTGIDGYQLRHYLRVQEKTNIPVILFFLQLNDATAQKNIPKDAGECPTGIYACPVSRKPDATYSRACGLGCSVEKASMAYWSINNLIRVGSLDELPPVGRVSRNVTTPSLEEGMKRVPKSYNPRVEK